MAFQTKTLSLMVTKKTQVFFFTHNQRFKGSPASPGCLSGAAPHSLVIPAARWAHLGPALPLAPAGQERHVRMGPTREAGGSTPVAAGACQGRSLPCGLPATPAPQARPWSDLAVGAPLPRPHNRLLRLKPYTGASRPAAAPGPRGARRETRSGFRLEAAPAPGRGVGSPGRFAAAGGGAVPRSECSGDPSRRIAPARLQGRL